MVAADAHCRDDSYDTGRDGHRAAGQGQREAVGRDRADRPDAAHAGDRHRHAGGEAGAGRAARRECHRGGGAVERAARPESARHGHSRGEVRRRERRPADEQRAAVAIGRVVEAGDRPQAAQAVDGDLLAVVEAEAPPGQAVAAGDPAGRQVERTRHLEVVGYGDGGRDVRAREPRCVRQQQRAARTVGGVGEAGDRVGPVEPAAHDRYLLPDREAGPGKAHPVAARQLARGGVKGACQRQQRGAATVHGREPAMGRSPAGCAVGAVVGAGHERALDRQVVVALAEQDVEHLDRRHVVVGGEVAARVELDRPVADASRVDARLAKRERRSGREQVAEVDPRAHAQAGEGGRGQHARLVLVAAVAVDVQCVDLLPLGRLRRDSERGAVAFARQQDRRVQRAVGVGGAAFDGQRAADAAQCVRLLREDLQVLASWRQQVVHVREQRHVDLLEPVHGAERHGRGPLRDRRRRGNAGRLGGAGQLEDVQVAAAGRLERLDLVDRGIGVDLDQLALDEAAVEPARAVRACDLTRGEVVGEQMAGRAGVHALLGELADRDAGERGWDGRRRRQRQGLAVQSDREHVVVGVIRATGACDADPLAGHEAVVEEAREL